MPTLHNTKAVEALRAHKTSCAVCTQESAAGLRGLHRTCAEVLPLVKAFRVAERRARNAAARREVYASLGMVRVKGANGGTYYE